MNMKDYMMMMSERKQKESREREHLWKQSEKNMYSLCVWCSETHRKPRSSSKHAAGWKPGGHADSVLSEK